jgi:outer membrane protein TolC
LTKEAAETERKQLESELYALKERVNQLYFGCLLQEDLLLQNRLLQKDLQINLERIGALIANGMANESDKELLEVELLRATQQETEMDASRLAYLRMLSYFIGIDDPESLELERPVIPAMNLSMRINHPELAVFEAKSAYADAQSKGITANLMPRFGAFVQAGYGRPGLNFLEDEFNPFYLTGVRMTWNLGGLYTRKNERRKVDVFRRQIDVARETFLFNTRMKLIHQQEEIQKLVRIMQSDEEIIRLRESVKKAAEAKLTNGVIAVSDLVREINAADLARQAAAIHQTQHLMAIYQFMYMTNNNY